MSPINWPRTLSQLPGCASLALGNNAGKERKTKRKWRVRNESNVRPSESWETRAFWSRAVHGAVTSFCSFVTAGGGANRLGVPNLLAERRVSMMFDIS